MSTEFSTTTRFTGPNASTNDLLEVVLKLVNAQKHEYFRREKSGFGGLAINKKCWALVTKQKDTTDTWWRMCRFWNLLKESNLQLEWNYDVISVAVWGSGSNAIHGDEFGYKLFGRWYTNIIWHVTDIKLWDGTFDHNQSTEVLRAFMSQAFVYQAPL